MNSALIILLLISPDFLASNYCYGIEMRRALERHQRREARAIPVILRPSVWEGSPLSTLQALPLDVKPVTLWEDRDSAFVNIVNGIKHVIRELTKTSQDPSLHAQAQFQAQPD
jgi:hypothetical protein